MSEKTTFCEMFPALCNGGALGAALDRTDIISAVIDRCTRALELTLESEADLSPFMEDIRQGLAEQYGLSTVTIRAEGQSVGDEELLAACRETICREYPAARGILAGAEFGIEGDRVHILIVNGGKEAVIKELPGVTEKLRERYGRDLRITVESRKDAPEEDAFSRTEALRRAALESAAAAAPVKKKTEKKAEDEVIMGRAVKGEPVPMDTLNLDSGVVTVQGRVFSVNHRELKKRKAWVVSFDVTDEKGSVRVSKFMEEKDALPITEKIKEGMILRIGGRISFDRFDNDIVLDPMNISVGKKALRMDTSEEKRVELHLHTRFSNMDGLTDPKAVVSTAARWGHKAIAVTDHGVAQGFPDMWKAGADKGVKIIYGVEAYFVNDIDDTAAVRGAGDQKIDGEFVAFDIETTGLSALNDEIIEFGAVIFRDGEAAETFSTFVDPGRPIPPKIIQLTGINDDMVRGAPKIEQALEKFLEFAGDLPIVAHNADFDIGFLKETCRRQGIERKFVSIDTLALSRALLPGLKKFKLDIVANHLSLAEFNHHRATDDALTCGNIYLRLRAKLMEKGAKTLGEVNHLCRLLRGEGHGGRMRHIILLVKDKTGLKNLYKIISESHLKYFKRFPLVPKTLLNKYREGLIVGSACENSELFSAVVGGKSWQDLRNIAEYYDFLEIQPVCNNMFMLRRGMAKDVEQLRDFNRTMVRLGKEMGKPVCATGDVHFLEPEDEVYRRILLATKKFEDCDEPLPIYFKTTDEMLEEFSYLGQEDCYDVVIRNTNLIADMCQEIELLPKGKLFPPKLENSDGELKELVWGKVHRLYGENPPEIVTERVNKEMESILGRHYDVIYMSAQKLVADSLAHGYLVGSRGSVGSSLVAYMSGITEVNSLAPHYRCPKCKHTDFEAGKEYGCGADMPDAVCPVCGEKYEKDGFNIPFETFLGYGGKKVPDIDLNFSGEYQAKAHRYTFELFGEDHVFRAGTIGTVAEKTAYGYVKKYLEERGRHVTKAEELRLAQGCVGIKRTTGQHPGGMVVVPGDMEIYDFCPIQHPADDTGTDIITTHFEYHCMEDNLLKLDMLGHDDPTIIRMLEDLTGVDAKKIPLDDQDTMSLFTTSRALGFENDPILGPTGACAIPEFGTKFVRGMLIDTQPTEFDTLLRISGFSHGTDVWLGNARDLITSGTCSVHEAIGCRDDIMLYLIGKDMDMERSFTIMEAVRKGKGLKPEWEQEMKEHGVPQWYIDSCNKIKYMFPKAHAVAYVIMAFRIAWFKVHRPLAFYAAYFSIRAKNFDATVMCRGMETALAKMKEIEGKDAPTAAEQDMLVTLEVCYEFYKRGFTFHQMDIMESHARNFLIRDNGLVPPFVSLPGLGESAADSIQQEREGLEFVSIEEFALACPKVSKSHIEQLKLMGAFGNLPESSQLTLF